MSSELYADHNASADLLDEVKEYLMIRMKEQPFCNPSSQHIRGIRVKMAIENCRSRIAELLGCETKQIIFTSGATESINSVFNSISVANTLSKSESKTFIISQIEHPSTIYAAQSYSRFGYETIKPSTMNNGTVSLASLESVLSKNTNKGCLVAVLAANNETGVLQPIDRIAEICRQFELPFLCDTTQLIGKENFSFADRGMDFCIASSHKLGALPGSGLLICRDPQSFHPLIQGGGQEGRLRGGTENYLGTEAMTVALDFSIRTLNQGERIRTLRDKFEKRLKRYFPKVEIIGQSANRLANTSLLAYPGTIGAQVQMALNDLGIQVGLSSACTDASLKTSHVLHSMGLKKEFVDAAIRISLPYSEDIEKKYDRLFHALNKVYSDLTSSAQTIA